MPSNVKRTGILCIVSGPSGVGKTTLCRSQAKWPGYVYSISCTTRPPRDGEINGVDYHFLLEEEFLDRIKRRQFLEHAEVHGYYYGTLRSVVIGLINAGTDVLLDLDVQGAEHIRRNQDPAIREAFVDVFVMPPSLVELHRRLSGRGDTDAETLATRMDNARQEMRRWRDYRYLITSGTQQEDRVAFDAILGAERRRVDRLHLIGAMS